MQVVILCGGQGTRIRDVADDIPKPMIPIGDKPILWHIMKAYAHYGFKEFILCLGYKSWAIKRWLLDYHLLHASFTFCLGQLEQIEIHNHYDGEDWRITFAETGPQSMTGCRLKRVEQFIRGNTFMLTYGDGVSDLNIQELVRFHHQHGRIGTVTAVRPPGRFGELDIHDRQVLAFKEKPLHAAGCINGGFFVFDRRVFERLDDDESLVLEQRPLMGLARDGELMAFDHDGFWHPMDNSRDYQHLNHLWAINQAPWKSWRPFFIAPWPSANGTDGGVIKESA
jgi:glucose-1-phosphate cytidylyltransferase